MNLRYELAGKLQYLRVALGFRILKTMGNIDQFFVFTTTINRNFLGPSESLATVPFVFERANDSNDAFVMDIDNDFSNG